MDTLPHSFIDWWFAPWEYAADEPAYRPLSADRVAQRDGYRLWCRQAGVQPDLPDSFDPAWQSAALDDGIELTAAVRLFAGLIAAREHNDGALRQLSIADRKWCASIAATQPLRACGTTIYAADEAIEIRGAVELAYRLRNGFPGMWSRLRLTLAPPLATRIDALLEAASARHAGGGDPRSLRCWNLCRQRAVGTTVQHHSAKTTSP
jgi:hypothetical protein